MRIPKIQTTLYANAAFCSLSALLIVFLPGLLAEYIINLPAMVFILLGAGLLVFALDVFLTARKTSPSRGKVLYIFFADKSWLLMTPVVMIMLSDRITSLGNILLVDIALVVAVFAAFEWAEISKMRLNSE